jgi:hypothetical protein
MTPYSLSKIIALTKPVPVGMTAVRSRALLSSEGCARPWVGVDAPSRGEGRAQPGVAAGWNRKAERSADRCGVKEGATA